MYIELLMKRYVPGKLKPFFSKYKSLTYKKGDTILRADDQPQGVYYIKTGFVKLDSILVIGRELTLNIFKPGTFFPMMWAIGNIPNSYFFIAQTDVSVNRAPKNEVLIFLKKNPEVLFELTKRILIGLSGVLANIEYMLSGDCYHRVVGATFLCAKRFGQKGKDAKLTINLPLTHQDIANIAGISRETTSISLKKLEKKRIISYKNRLIIVNSIKKLSQESLNLKKEYKTLLAA